MHLNVHSSRKSDGATLVAHVINDSASYMAFVVPSNRADSEWL
jgi:hypothetical protein